MKTDMIYWLNKQKDSRPKKAFPILSFPSTAYLNCSVYDMITNSSLQSQGIKLIAEKTDSSACVSMMDLSVEAECFGATVHFKENEVPTVDSLIHTPEDINNLMVPEVGSFRSGIFIDAIKEAVKVIKDKPIFAGIIGPYSLAARLMSVSELMLACFDNPQSIHTLLSKCTEFLIKYAKAFKAIGSNGIIIAEPVTGLLSPDLAEIFSEPYVRNIVDSIQDDSFIVIYHNCGNNTKEMISSILSINAKVYHFGNTVDMSEIIKLVPPDTIVMGNIDPTDEFLNGTAESITKKTKDLLEKCGKYNNFIISSGCDITYNAKWDNINAFFDTVNRYYKVQQ